MTGEHQETVKPSGDLAEVVVHERWRLDGTASSAEFRVKHFWGLTTVAGRFRRLEGGLESGKNPKINLTMDAASVDTGNGRRDTHLRSADFFDVARHPEVTFESTSIGRIEAGKLRIAGRLTAAGKTQEVAVDTTIRPTGDRLEIEGATLVDRTAFGMTWSPLGMASGQAELRLKATLVPDSAV
jgi:polyisoprenoid-binding protein YceI